MSAVWQGRPVGLPQGCPPRVVAASMQVRRPGSGDSLEGNEQADAAPAPASAQPRSLGARCGQHRCTGGQLRVDVDDHSGRGAPDLVAFGAYVEQRRDVGGGRTRSWGNARLGCKAAWRPAPHVQVRTDRHPAWSEQHHVQRHRRAEAKGGRIHHRHLPEPRSEQRSGAACRCHPSAPWGVGEPRPWWWPRKARRRKAHRRQAGIGERRFERGGSRRLRA